MAISSINSSSVQGIQRGLQQLDSVAQDIASAGVQGGQDVQTIAESSVKAKQAELQVKASVSVLQAEDEVRGTLLDILA